MVFGEGRNDRRVFPRVSAENERTLVVLPQENFVGQLLNISMGGLSLKYAGVPGRAFHDGQYGILFGRDDLWLKNIPLKTVNDTIVTIPFQHGQACIRRRGMRFGQLSPEQKALLKQFIWINGD